MGPHMRLQERGWRLGVRGDGGARDVAAAEGPADREAGDAALRLEDERSGPPREERPAAGPVAADRLTIERRDGRPVGLDRRTHPRVVESGRPH